MEILGFQTNIAWENRSENASRILAMIPTSGEIPSGSLMVFPELSTSGFTMNLDAAAEARDGESAHFFSNLAKQHGCHVLAGIAGRDEASGLGANEALCFSPEGREIARYRKRNPFPLANEGTHYPPGNEAVVFEIGDWKVAPLICYDLRFPEPFREAAALGAELFVVIANWPVARVDHWTTLLRARAIENLAYVVGVNRAGEDPYLQYPGSSIVVGPKGEVLAEAGSEPCVLRAELDHDALLQWRRDFPALDCFQVAL